MARERQRWLRLTSGLGQACTIRNRPLSPETQIPSPLANDPCYAKVYNYDYVCDTIFYVDGTVEPRVQTSG